MSGHKHHLHVDWNGPGVGQLACEAMGSDWENSGAHTHLLLSQTLRNPVQTGHGVLPPCLGTDAKKVVHHAGEISGLKFVLGG